MKGINIIKKFVIIVLLGVFSIHTLYAQIVLEGTVTDCENKKLKLVLVSNQKKIKPKIVNLLNEIIY